MQGQLKPIYAFYVFEHHHSLDYQFSQLLKIGVAAFESFANTYKGTFQKRSFFNIAVLLVCALIEREQHIERFYPNRKCLR